MTLIKKKLLNRLKSILCPIQRDELGKFVPLLLMFLCVSFNYSILKNVKDALIITAPGSGAEAIPFLKVWCVTPAAVFFMLAYTKLSNILTKQKLFYVSVISFLVFFGIFSFFIYPMKDFLHPGESGNWLEMHLPSGCKGLIAIYKNWSFALFYVIAELWGTAAFSLILWGFANDITRIDEARRFYPLLGIGSNIGLLLAGPLVMHFSRTKADLPAHIDTCGNTLNSLMACVILGGIVFFMTYYWMQKKVLPNPVSSNLKNNKLTLSFKESFQHLFKSSYLRSIALLVICYGVSINIIEVTWKEQLKAQFPNTNDYIAFMGLFSMITGITTIFMMLFVGSSLLRKKGWNFTALCTPIMILITGSAFFIFVIFQSVLTPLTAFLGLSPIMLAVIFGMIQNILSKSSKYSLFDPTKEMAYIPLDEESKVKGKAAIDVVGGRLGKSGGALLQQILFITLGPLSVVTPYIAIILFGVILVWTGAAKSLGKQFGQLISEQEREKDASNTEGSNVNSMETSNS